MVSTAAHTVRLERVLHTAWYGAGSQEKQASGEFLTQWAVSNGNERLPGVHKTLKPREKIGGDLHAQRHPADCLWPCSARWPRPPRVLLGPQARRRRRRRQCVSACGCLWWDHGVVREWRGVRSSFSSSLPCGGARSAHWAPLLFGGARV